MAEGTRQAVFDRVRLCLANLSGGSGHLAAYHLDPDSFEITGTEPVEGEATAYAFTVEGSLETEFEHVGSDPGPENLEGTIVLDGDLQLTRDEDGLVRIDPFSCAHPAAWPPTHRARLPEAWPEHEDQVTAVVDEVLDGR